jgi:hypothetical protein
MIDSSSDCDKPPLVAAPKSKFLAALDNFGSTYGLLTAFGDDPIQLARGGINPLKK